MADVDLFVVEKHAIDSLDGSVGSLGGLVVDKAIALGAALFVGRDLAGKDIPEGGKSIVESLSRGKWDAY